MPIALAFDIGYASIGWCVLSSQPTVAALPDILGTGVVTFPTDDCLASTRRNLRRTRRHIRSTRQRIERMKLWLLHRGVLSRENLDKPGHAAPFLLAAAALQGHRTLSALELWHVLRWYAHNRGYDGNSRWALGVENSEDTEKEQAALALMAKHGTTTMAETVCACLNLNPVEHDKRISSFLPYKTLNAAYPRKCVSAEVGRLFSLHLGRIPGLDAATIRLIMSGEKLSDTARNDLSAADVRLPKRYEGGLLFGQLVPRFDNRIISRCPVTWAVTYDEEIMAGKSDKDARHLAEKFAKVPAAKSKEFLDYRFARILANIKADGRPLNKELRNVIWNLALEKGSLSQKDLEREIKKHCGTVPNNLEAYFNIHPDSEEALVLDPVMDEIRKAEGSRAKISPFWKMVPPTVKTEAKQAWSLGKGVSFAWLLEKCGNSTDLLAAFEKDFVAANRPKKGRIPYATFEEYLHRNRVAAKFPGGRAPYARPVLRQVVAEVLDGFDPNKPSRSTKHPDGENKMADGILYPLADPSSRIRELQSERPLDDLTNNHLVRHRMLILDRLCDDLCKEFVNDGRFVSRVIVEVARELREFSGMSAKQIASELNSRLKDFKGAVAYLDKNAPHLERNGSLIRKCRIAMDLDWCCPFTGEKYDATDLPKMEREHIIPYATRNSNALHALVLTWPEVNRMKGKRTARQFIAENEGKVVDGKSNLSLFTLRGYDGFVEKLDTKGHPDDARRKRARKALLAINEFEDKELGFTEGLLTQTSHLMKLAMRGMSKRFPNALCDPIPGPVTAEIRKAWTLAGTLSLACPEVIDSNGKVRPKDEIRGLTHMHHALDAAVIALAAHYFPLQFRGQDQKGKIWQALLKRNRSSEEKEFLYHLGIFDRYQRHRRDKDGREFKENDVRLKDLPKELKDKLSRSFAECRVMQHVPADRSGAKAELTTWGVLRIEGEGDDARVSLRQQASKVENGLRVIEVKQREERAGKLLGVNPKNGSGKLKAIKGAMIIGENYGIALDPEPTVIPFHKVQHRLNEIRKANGGRSARVLRNGMLVRLRGQGVRDGIWRINSIKASLRIDMSRAAIVGQPSKGEGVWREVSVASLLKKGIEMLPFRYAGYVLTD